MKTFTDSRKRNAVLFMKEQGYDDKLGGKWTNGNSYDHILKIDEGHNQYDVICKYNLLADINPDLFSVPHRFAHHLTSSQVMCYNFFRPLIYDNGKPSSELISILGDKHISIPNESICEFEATNPIDNTSYDMAIGPVKFEIKFTENGFGKAKTDERHKVKFNNVYHGLIEKCKCLVNYPDVKIFFSYYQLFRNILHIDDKNKYAVFIFPKDNKQCRREFNEFLQFIKDDFRENIQVWHWETLLEGKEGSDFYKKYLRQ